MRIIKEDRQLLSDYCARAGVASIQSLAVSKFLTVGLTK